LSPLLLETGFEIGVPALEGQDVGLPERVF